MAIEFPAEVARHTKQLETVALNDDFPHVGMREAARRALLTCMKADRSKAAQTLRRRLNDLHVSKLPGSDKPARKSPNFHWNRPKEMPEPEPTFYFDYDFGRYDVEGLGNLFGLPRWQVDDDCLVWIRRWDADIRHMHDFRGRGRPSGHSEHAMGWSESFQSYGAYLSRLSLALVAGKLLLTRPLDNSGYVYRPWDEWLRRYSPTQADGLWLSDGTDRYPESALHDLKAGDLEKERPSEDHELLRPLLGIGPDTEIGDLLIVDGSWSSPDGVSVSISSALVAPGESEIAARAVNSAPRTHLWLPNLQDYEEEGERLRDGDMAPLEGWIVDAHAELQIDKYDPLGCRDAIQRQRPAQRVIDALKLQTDEPWRKYWRDPEGRIAFQCNAWGHLTGEGQHESAETGSALLIDRTVLSEMLTRLDRDLLLLVKLQFYKERNRYDGADKGEDTPFTYSHHLLIIDRGLQAVAVAASDRDSAVVQALGEYDRYDFGKRLQAQKKEAPRTAGQSH